MTAAPGAAQTAQQQVVRQLRAQGYRNIRVQRTWLGRVRIVADSRLGRREIVLNPSTGAILRDYLDRGSDGRSGSGGGSSGSGSSGRDGSGGSDDDDDDDDDNSSGHGGGDDDDHDDNSGQGSDNSGSGSGNSGGGGDDDDDD